MTMRAGDQGSLDSAMKAERNNCPPPPSSAHLSHVVIGRCRCLVLGGGKNERRAGYTALHRNQDSAVHLFRSKRGFCFFLDGEAGSDQSRSVTIFAVNPTELYPPPPSHNNLYLRRSESKFDSLPGQRTEVCYTGCSLSQRKIYWETKADL